LYCLIEVFPPQHNSTLKIQLAEETSGQFIADEDSGQKLVWLIAL